MNKAVQEYIEKNTRRCSNLAHYEDANGNVWGKNEPWLTPSHATAVALIAREETIKEVCEFLLNHNDYICSHYPSIWFDMEKCVSDLKKHLEGKVCG